MFQEDITPVSPTQSQSVTFQRSEARDWSAPRIWANLSEFKVVKQSALRHCCRPHQLYPRLRAKLRPRLVGKRPTYWWTTGGGPESCGTFKTALRVVKTHPGDTPFRFAQYIVIHTYTVIHSYTDVHHHFIDIICCIIDSWHLQPLLQAAKVDWRVCAWVSDETFQYWTICFVLPRHTKRCVFRYDFARMRMKARAQKIWQIPLVVMKVKRSPNFDLIVDL